MSPNSTMRGNHLIGESYSQYSRQYDVDPAVKTLMKGFVGVSCSEGEE